MFTSHSIKAKGCSSIRCRASRASAAQCDGIAMSLEDVAKQTANRFFIVDNQNVPVFKEGLLCISIRQSGHGVYCWVIGLREWCCVESFIGLFVCDS